MAYGIPTSVDPIIIDVSASVTTNGMTNRLAGGGQRGAHAWWLTPDGQPTDDPAVLADSPPGTILPLGGIDAGHKGYALGLQVEAATAALAGHGRADQSEGWGATVYLQVTDPQAFAGLGEFNRQTDWLRDACRANKPRDPSRPVRLPGERGLARKREQLAGGIELHPAIVPALAGLAARLGPGRAESRLKRPLRPRGGRVPVLQTLESRLIRPLRTGAPDVCQILP
ncbi:MAG: Ldh family oxidoreductase [Burkholderiaceae bacterium]